MPEGIATHSRAQEFYFGADGLLRRQDYTLDIADGSRIANYALDIVDVDGIRIASKRRAYLCNKTYDVLRDRLIIRLDLGNFQLNPRVRGAGRTLELEKGGSEPRTLTDRAKREGRAIRYLYGRQARPERRGLRSEEHTSELPSL